MKNQEQNPGKRRSHWLVAGALVAGIAILTFFLLKPEPPPPEALAPAEETPAATKRPPKFVTGESLPGQDTVSPSEMGAPANMAACTSCEQENRTNGKCVKKTGCEGLAGEDLTLCENLLSCLMAHPECYQGNPADCYCGEAKGNDCITAPKGVCLKEALAATKTDDLDRASERYFHTDFPSGRASQVAACRRRFCVKECKSATAQRL